MSEMIERIARAIEDAEGAHGEHIGDYERLARSAIAAMREPTEAMWKAEHPVWALGRPMWEWWRAMIDEALK